MARVAWSLVVVVALLVVLDVVVAAQAVSLTSETAVAVHGFPLVHGACLGSALMGALVVSRYPRHPIGWLLSAVGVLTAVSLLSEAYAYWEQEADGPGSAASGGVAAWLAQLCGGQVVVALLALMFLLAPDGRFLTPRWRYAALVPAVGAVVCLAAIVSVDPTDFDLLDAEDRFGPVRSALLGVGFTLISLGVVLGVVSMVRRMRRSTGIERLQLRMVALSAGLAALGLLDLFVVQAANGGEQTWLAGVPLFAAFLLMPVLFAVAVLRYRLYDLDVIVNRTLVVVTGAVFAATGYVTLVVVVGQLVVGWTGGFWLSFLGTVLVALAFQPLRRVVVRLADRAAYGARAEPYQALADLTRRLAQAPDPDDLLPAVAEAAARAVSARGARATLDVPGGEPVAGTWGWWSPDAPVPADQVVPVRTEGRELGRIAVALPRGRDLRVGDRRLLEALADQTGLAFRNSTLAGALAERVADLDRTTRRLDDSRRRLISADDAARRALEAAIARDVLPALLALPGEIGRARSCLDRGADPGLGVLVDDTQQALESLRELTRGVFPVQLARSGLGPSLRSLLGRSGRPTDLRVDPAADQRYPPRVEAAVYSCCAEAVHGPGGPVVVDLRRAGADLVLQIAGAHEELDLQQVIDRVEAAGGTVWAGDRLVRVRLPVVPAPGAAAPAAAAGVAGFAGDHEKETPPDADRHQR